MGRLREIQRTATFAWSPAVAAPLLATATRADAVDANFSTETKLEIWSATESEEPLASLKTDSRFYDIAWSKPTTTYPEGVIGGALENGSLALWDVSKLKKDAQNSLISRTTEHSGAVKALQFNPHRPELLASCGEKGELFITDLNNPENPYRVGAAAARSDSFDCIDWNKKVPHILVTGSSAGFVTVWDIKTKKESLTLNNYGRKPVSAVAWNPDEPTKLATAIPTDQDPLILLWNLRNSSAPERILKAHDQGVLSLAWSCQDSELLLSCGKDNRSICWNPHTGHVYGEFPMVTNWTFQARWNPSHPSFCATASFDGKISVYSIQNTVTGKLDPIKSTAPAADGEDFFAQAQSQGDQGTSFSLQKPPKWMRRPVGVCFGFGGLLVTFKPLEESGTKSSVRISRFVADAAVDTSIADFEKAIMQGNTMELCDNRIESASTDGAKEEWRVFKALISEAPRKALLAHLGFDMPTEGEAEKEDPKTESTSAGPTSADGVKAKDENRLSSFFDNAGDGQNFLADLAASKGAKTNNPFSIYNGSESSTDRHITQALVLGSFEKALNLCLKENRISDAFMIAVCGGQDCIDKVQTAYFAQKSNGPNYLRVLASVVGKNLWDIVHNADLANWHEVMATLCTYADQSEFPDLCEALGDRLEESASTRRDAAFCYLAGSKLEKVVPLWISEMEDLEKELIQSGQDSPFAVHVQALQGLIEKVTVFRKATKYSDTDGATKSSDWKLESLYVRYVEYADLVAGFGHMKLAEQLLGLLPAKYARAQATRTRLERASGSAKPSAGAQQAKIKTAGNVPVPANSYQPQQSFAVPSRLGTSPGPRTSSPGYTPTNAYRPEGINYAYQPAGPSFALPPPPQPGAPPINASGSSQLPPLLAKKQDTSNWNDLPDSFHNTSVPRRSTPGPSVASPFPNQNLSQNHHQGPSAPPPPQHRAPLPPPPKAGQSSSGISSPVADHVGTSMDPTNRPPSAATSAYAPAQPSYTPSGSAMSPPSLAPPGRNMSPYNAPPSAAPPSNRYAPTAGAATPTSGFSGGAAVASRPPIAPGPYAGGPQYAPATSQAPVRGPPMTSTGPPRAAVPPPPQTNSAAATPPATPKYPSGDRTRIPTEALSIYQFLDAEMQRVKGRAPAQFKQRVDDTEKRLNILFDQLNDGTVAQGPSLQHLQQLTMALQARNFDEAQRLHGELTKHDEVGGSKWLVGIKFLIPMSRATPPS